jgi:hypothetical protein
MTLTAEQIDARLDAGAATGPLRATATVRLTPTTPIAVRIPGRNVRHLADIELNAIDDTLVGRRLTMCGYRGVELVDCRPTNTNRRILDQLTNCRTCIDVLTARHRHALDELEVPGS